MSSSEVPASEPASQHADESYLPVEDVADRLGLPLAILLRRIEAGDVPARRVEGAGGVEWTVRLSDLGVEDGSLDDEEEAAEAEAPPPDDEPSVVPDRAARRGRRQPETGEVERAVARLQETPAEVRAEVAGMLLDPRELVSGLLDRWERTLEQRIYAEQRQRFEAELNARQNLVKQLQLELQTARAEHAAAQAERDRRMAELERRIWDLQRELDSANESLSRRRGLFRRH